MTSLDGARRSAQRPTIVVLVTCPRVQRACTTCQKATLPRRSMAVDTANRPTNRAGPYVVVVLHAEPSDCRTVCLSFARSFPSARCVAARWSWSTIGPPRRCVSASIATHRSPCPRGPGMSRSNAAPSSQSPGGVRLTGPKARAPEHPARKALALREYFGLLRFAHRVTFRPPKISILWSGYVVRGAVDMRPVRSSWFRNPRNELPVK